MSRVYESCLGDGGELDPLKVKRMQMSGMFDPSKFEPIKSIKEHIVNSSEQEDDTEETIIDTAVSVERKIDRTKFLIDLSKEYPQIEYTMKINGIDTFPKGNLQAIKAKAKEGKSISCFCLVTGLLRGNFLTIESLIKSPKILYFATEESIGNVCCNNQKIHKLCGWDTVNSNENFLVYSIRETDIKTRVDFIEQEITIEKPDVVFVDGIRDLLIDFNNIKESYELVNWLMQLSGIYNCAIVCVLHTNKAQSDFNMRGHLGTELLNKSSDVLEVTKIDKNYIVKNTDSRNLETGDWAFCFDEDGLLKAGEVQDKKQDKVEQRMVKMKNDFSTILTEDKILSHSNLRVKYMALSGFKNDAAINHIKEMTGIGFLKKREDGKYELS